VDQYWTVGLLFLHHKDFVEQVVQSCELLRVFFDGRIVCPRKHLVVLDLSFIYRLSSGLISLLQDYDSSGDAISR